MPSSVKPIVGGSAQLVSKDEEEFYNDPPKEQLKLYEVVEVEPWESVTSQVVTTVEGLIQNNFAVLDNFVAQEEAMHLRDEVKRYHDDGLMVDGQIGKGRTASDGSVRREMRTDKVVWMEGAEDFVSPIMKRHILRMDIFTQKIAMLLRAIAPPLTWEGSGRTKIMATCYPAGGSRYVAHFDNPDGNGRKLTAILYLNERWREDYGGILRIKTKGVQADVAPLFNRLLCFWSDRRCPHEVMPTAEKTRDGKVPPHRYAITIWFLDEKERKEAHDRAAAQLQLQQ